MYTLQGKTQTTRHVRFPRQSTYARFRLPAGGPDTWQPLPSQPMKQWRKPNIYRQQATRLTMPISPTCDRYVQYFLIGTNTSVINRHRRELPHRNFGIATTLSPPFPSKCSTGPPKWPRPVSILSNINLQ
jgi:hypothetical protein